jgi:hypothetical protein
MKHKTIPINSGSFLLHINKDGELDGEYAWNLNENIPQEGVDAVVEFLHGMMACLQTRFDETRELGRAYQAGMHSEKESADITFEPDFEETTPENVVTFTPSARKN